MSDFAEVLFKAMKDCPERTAIYNRAYEAVYRAIKMYSGDEIHNDQKRRLHE
jgi:hypothetical protein